MSTIKPVDVSYQTSELDKFHQAQKAGNNNETGKSCGDLIIKKLPQIPTT
jgi:hypothetical protein